MAGFAESSNSRSCVAAVASSMATSSWEADTAACVFCFGGMVDMGLGNYSVCCV